MRKKVVSLILRNKDKILVGQRKKHRPTDPGKTVFPGGHIKPGEGLITAIKREAKEELDIILLNPRLVFSAVFDGPEEKQKIFWFFCDKYVGTPKALEDETIYWIKKTELDKLSYPICIEAANAVFR